MQANEIALRYESAIRRWFFSRVVSPEDGEDLTQDVMVSIIQGWSRFDGRSSERTWVYSICRNTLFNSYRRWKTRTSVLPDPPIAGNSAEQRLIVRIAVETLPKRFQVLYLLRYDQGLGIREIAARLGRSEGTIKYQFYEMRIRLGKILR